LYPFLDGRHISVHKILFLKRQLNFIKTTYFRPLPRTFDRTWCRQRTCPFSTESNLGSRQCWAADHREFSHWTIRPPSRLQSGSILRIYQLVWQERHMESRRRRLLHQSRRSHRNHRRGSRICNMYFMKSYKTMNRLT